MTYRIISDFHDYYDYMQNWGVDPHKVWNRHSQDYQIGRDKLPNITDSATDLSNQIGLRHSYAPLYPILTGVCGEWTLAHVLPRKYPDDDLYESSTVDKIFVPGVDTVDDFDDDLIEEMVWSDCRGRERRDRTKSRILSWINDTFPRETHNKIHLGVKYTVQKTMIGGYDDWLFREYQSPLIIINMGPRTPHLITNPSFVEWGLTTLYPDVQNLWVNITQFLDNELSTAEAPQVVDSEVLRDAKGFDDKSFRNTKNRLRK